MTKHLTGTRDEWLAARLGLLKEEKELTRRSDELARRRQELPWVRVDKAYRFDTDEGSASLKDLFRGRSQLLVYHFMFGPDYTAGCVSCSAVADGFNGIVVHLANHDVMLTAVSRAPLAKLQAYRRRMGWTFPWASSLASDFNFDFNVSFTEQQQRAGSVDYNFERGGHAMDATPVPPPVAQLAAMSGTDAPTYSRDRPGVSAFVLEDGVVYHTYSSYARGVDGLWGMYQWLDRAPWGAMRRAPGSAAMTNTARLEDSPMTEPFVVRRETYIAAPPATVFAFLTDPEKIVRWMGSEATTETHPGGLIFSRGSTAAALRAACSARSCRSTASPTASAGTAARPSRRDRA